MIKQGMSIGCALWALGTNPIASEFTNGSFELPGGLAEHSSIVLAREGGKLTGWSIGGTGGPISYANQTIGSLDFPPVDGSYHIAFNGGDQAAGTFIRQTFDTFPGGDYVVEYSVSRLGGAAGEISITVAISDGASEITRFKSVAETHGYGPRQRVGFVARSKETTITFTDTSNEVHGVDVGLDDVRVTQTTPRFEIEPIKFSKSLGCRLEISLPASAVRVSLEYSEDLIDWSPLPLLFEASGSLRLTDQSAAATRMRFYRVAPH